MKNKIRLLSFACALVMLGNYYVNAQNPIWTLAPNYWDGENLFPLPISPNGDPGYEGQPADNAHNGIWLPNGEMLFFAVDNQVYFPDGEYICEFRDETQNYVSGHSEMCIVPDPRFCGDRYYIFMSNSAGDQNFRYPFCAQIDMAYPSISGYNDFGAPVNDGFDSALNLPTPTESSDNIHRLDDLLDLEDDFGNPVSFNNITHEGYAFAAAQLSDEESYLVLASSGSVIYRILVDCDGMHPVNPQLNMVDIITQIGAQEGYEKSELELVNLNNGNLRVGITYKSGNNRVVASFDVNESGDYISGTSFAHELNESSPSDPTPFVKGLEFSESGRYLYFTHHQTTGNPDVVQYLDVDLETVHVLDVPNASDYQYSQIEMGTTGELYFAHANGLATFNVPDDPGQFDPQTPALTWNASAVQTTISQSNSGFPLDDSKYSYLLPDQVDGLDYADIIVYPHTVYIADVSETWTTQNNPFITVDGVVRIKEELRITSGTTINIEDMRFEFYEDARVVVEPGARLNLDETIFTAGPGCCEDNLMWLGVEVHGNPEASQVQYTNQGFLDLKNKSIIEHAYIAALAGSREGGFNSTTFGYEKPGGIIKAINSRFRNNRRDVHLQNYIWQSNGNLVTNLSSFRNCDFVTDNLLNHPEVFPETHVYLYRVHSVPFRNCSFRNTTSFFDHAIDNRGAGILSFYSTFSVGGLNDTYEPADDAFEIDVNTHQTFYRLRTGVFSFGHENHHFTVDQMEFQLNQMGIQVFGSCFENITFNNFQVPEVSTDYPNENVGARIMNSYLFTIEENTFFGDQEITRNAGLVLDNTSKGWGPEDAEVEGEQVENEVYRNDFAHLELGIVVEHDNRGQNDNAGLQARCNTFTNNYRADIYLDAGTEWRDDQGAFSDISLLTNNVFSFSNPPCASQYRDVRVNDEYGSEQDPPSLFFQYHCLEDAITEPAMDYQHSSCPQDHIEVNNQTYPNITLDYQEHCPSNFSPGGGIKWPLAELEEKQTTAENNLASAKAVYQVTIDGGNTEDIVDLLENILNEESAYLRDLLMERYPLSREALIAAIDAAESFDPWHLTQVLVANAPLPADVYRFIEDNDVLEPFFFQFVEDAQASGGVNLGRLLYAEISLRSYEKSHAERAIHRHYLYHPDSLDGAAWSAYLDSRDEPYYQLYRIGEHIDQAETGAAQTLLDSLGIDSVRKEWVQFMIDLTAADTVTVNDISTGWDFFYNDPATRGDVWGWLTFQGELDSLPPLPEIIENRSLSLISPEDASKAERWLEAWPNPAKDRVVLTYPREADGIGTVQVFGPKGEFIREFAASDVGFQEINVTGWSPGLYIAKLIVNGKTFDTVKISVVR